ncbi:lipocalin-like domain-containing protein [Candidatus Marimicrobium litorale]|uniref:Lipocalin-like domain-containing protein n=1 Tax=Candidatus Marimicrobium litorale TaxID=2518991 RepID=A0ABT3TAB3_9GAMM|nr:lipocalin-like domain-containing protein [Candidatus Marimicrobium litorale]MCX2979238.1 hypothetical protein [Candidatus Marimicrobium litorale]
MLNKQTLIGTYKMASGEMQREDGTVEYPFGKDAIGFLAYTIDDLVWFEVNAVNRSPFKNGDWFGTKDENEEAMKTHLSFFGRYLIKGDELHYIVLTSSSPNMVEMSKGGNFFYGATARLNERILRLTSKPYLVDGVECQTQYVWEKMILPV